MSRRHSEKYNKIVDRAFDFVLEDCPVALGIVFIAYMNVIVFGSGRIFEKDQLPWSLGYAAALLGIDAGLLWLGKRKVSSYLHQREVAQTEKELGHLNERAPLGCFILYFDGQEKIPTPNENIRIEFRGAPTETMPRSITFILNPKHEDHIEVVLEKQNAGLRFDWGYYNLNDTEPMINVGSMSNLVSEWGLTFSPNRKSLYIRKDDEDHLVAQLLTH